jgi:hypothetical protein
MKINIWVPRETVWELNKWLKTIWDTNSGKLITFFHDKPVRLLDVVQVSISINDYQKIIDNNESIQDNVARQLGWEQTTTFGLETETQLQILFGD